jgi:hypothetical protein
MSCSNCCHLCKDDTPPRLSVTIEGTEYILRRTSTLASGFAIEEGHPTLGGCAWLADADTVHFGCSGTPAKFVQLRIRENSGGIYITLEVLGEDGFADVIMRWAKFIDGTDPINCTSALELPDGQSAAGFALVCTVDPQDPITPSPIPRGCGCPCGDANCCEHCTGSDYAARQW